MLSVLGPVILGCWKGRYLAVEEMRLTVEEGTASLRYLTCYKLTRLERKGITSAKQDDT